MAILFPNAAIMRRWAGALQASTQRAPLERFLRTRGLPVAARGPAQDSDNIARICLYVLDKGVGFYCREGAAGLSGPQMPVIGRVACEICFNLAVLIAEPQAWRVPALVGTAQLLSRYTDLAAAAGISAAAARDFTSQSCLRPDPSDFGPRASSAVGRNDECEIDEIAKRMARFLAETPRAEVRVPRRGAVGSLRIASAIKMV